VACRGSLSVAAQWSRILLSEAICYGMQPARNLRVTGEALELARLAYAATARFPKEERFGLIAQMRGAAVSIGSNIAEGCGRSTNAALRSFLHNALGSLSELEFQIVLCGRLALGDAVELESLARQLGKVRGMLVMLIARMPKTKPDHTPRR